MAREIDDVEVEGRILMCWDFRITTTEMRDWEPERITAFFQGMAMAIRARWGHCRELPRDAQDDLEALRHRAQGLGVDFQI